MELIATLRSAIASPGFIAEDALIKETEQHFVSTWQGFKVRGRLDRLDRTPDGYEITDYKTSKYISKPDVQLSIYETAVRERYPDESVRARYFSLKHAEVISSHAPDDLEERLAAARKRRWHRASSRPSRVATTAHIATSISSAARDRASRINT